METTEAYLERKHQEISLLNDCLESPLPMERPRSVKEVIEQKFRLTAALRAQHDLRDWTITETAWSQARPAIRPFEFRYDYQRADLEVNGPSFYDICWNPKCKTVYTSSGMAAISALLLASAHVLGQADILVPLGSYGETLELLGGYARHLRLITMKGPWDEVVAQARSPRILLLDSCVPASAFEAALRSVSPALDLLIFDTTCFSSNSGRIRRVLRRARNSRIPVAMVRSHTKLDSLGAEYGRLGSAVFVQEEKDDWWNPGSLLIKLHDETRNAVRLFGGAALPAHFPPYIGTPSYRALTNKRVAAILRNGRRTARYFESALGGLMAELHFAHGLYVTLRSEHSLDEAGARRAAAKMSDDLSGAGFPILHAGSFGFDFAATEWFYNATTDRYSIRLAVPDLPTALWDDLSRAAAHWWTTYQNSTVTALSGPTALPVKVKQSAIPDQGPLERPGPASVFQQDDGLM
jgi:hypothetical protein